MLDPVTTPLLLLVLGKLADEIIGGVCKDFLKDKLKGLISKAAKLGSTDDLQLAYESGMQQSYETCCEILLRMIEMFGTPRSKLSDYRDSLKAFINDHEVAAELFRSIEDPNDQTAPSHEVLQARWHAIKGRELPDDQLWLVTAAAYRSQAKKQSFLSEPLRDILSARNLDEIRNLIKRQGGVKTQVRRDKYSQRMRTKFSPVDLANLMPAYADDPGRMVIRDVFVAQDVRENPPPVEIPKDLAERATKGVRREAGDDTGEALDEQQLKKLGAAYVSQSAKPVLDVIAEAGNRLLVLTGEPGSGKTTLMRYLLTGTIEPPVDRESGKPLAWTVAFKDAFPLLIELRDFNARRRRNECASFLEYVDYMGKTDQWFIDQHAVNEYLDTGPSLVMFDGLDEIFDTADRERVMHEIAGFAQRYPKARIIVTSRPIGYKEQVLRDAGFAHFGMQDLDDGQIEAFIRGWFALTFPHQTQQAEQRIERVLGSVRQSKPIRLLAGNPMLLTIMALLAREEELPRERAKFYEKAVEVLCHHWAANRNLELPEDRYLNADDKKDLLRRIAMRMQAGEAGLKGNIIGQDDLEQEIQAFLIDEQWQANEAEARKAARRMIRQLRERNYILCLRGPHLYGFVHRTFLEYLTAAEYVRRFDRQPQQMTIDELVDLFDQHCRDDEWREVLRLICGQIDEQFVGQIVQCLITRTDLKNWDGIGALPELPLGMYCLNEVRNLSSLEAVARELLKQTIRFLTDAKRREGLSAFMAQEIMPASRELGPRWPGRKVLETCALSQVQLIKRGGLNFWSPFVAALGASRDVMLALATIEVDRRTWRVRRDALNVLVEKWPDETTRKLLTERAVQDENEYPRRDALQALVEKWPDEITRKLLAERAVQDGHGFPRESALEALAEKWPDETTRKLLEERAVQDEKGAPRRAALQALAERWPDETTRKLLEERAVQDENYAPRRAALQALAEKWPDETTRKLLAERAVQDEDGSPRRVALRALAEKWPDETTRKLLAERAVDAGLSAVRRAEHTVALGKLHSEFGRILFSSDLDGIFPYLDPTDPISRNHIEQAAKKANIAADRIDETVRSLSEYLGWDITRGSKSGSG